MWVAYVTENGRRRSRTAKTKQDAAKLLQSLKSTRRRAKGIPTVAEFALQLLQGELRDEHRYGTWATNETYGRTRLAPSDLGSMPLDMVRTAHVQHFIDQQKPLSGKGKLSPTTVRRIGALISMIFSKAKSPRYGHIEFNPCDGVEYPQIRETTKRTLSPEEASDLPSQADSPRLAAMVTVARDTGLRRGEICGLKWSDLKRDHLGNPFLIITQQIVRTEGSIGESTTKTRTSFKREVDLTPDALRAIESQPRRSEYIFTTETGRPVRPDNLSRDFRLLREKAGMPDLKLHGLRASYISIMLEAGNDVRTVQELVGHSSSRVTQEVYARSRRDLKVKAAQLFADRVPNKVSAPLEEAV